MGDYVAGELGNCCGRTGTMLGANGHVPMACRPRVLSTRSTITTDYLSGVVNADNDLPVDLLLPAFVLMARGDVGLDDLVEIFPSSAASREVPRRSSTLRRLPKIYDRTPPRGALGLLALRADFRGPDCRRPGPNIILRPNMLAVCPIFDPGGMTCTFAATCIDSGWLNMPSPHRDCACRWTRNSQTKTAFATHRRAVAMCD